VKQYENIFSVKSDVYERLFDTETKKSEYNKIELKPSVYVKGSGEYRYFLDKSVTLQEKKFDDVQGMNAWCKSMDDMGMEYYGKTTPKYQYLKDTYYFDKDKQYVNNDHDMRTWYIDIEVSQEFGFPFPNEAKAPVTLIQLYDSFDDKYYVIGYEDIEGHENPKDLARVKEYNSKYEFPDKTTYLRVSDEIEMYRYFMKLIKAKNPAIMTAWNGELFDFPYLVNRAKNIGLNANDLSPVQYCKCEYKKIGNSDVYNTTIGGVYLLDLMELYKKFIFTPQTSYSLNNIASVELGSEKVLYEEYSNLDELMNGNIDNYNKSGNDEVMDSLYDEICDIDRELERRGLL